jgi:hypothetical protein
MGRKSAGKMPFEAQGKPALTRINSQVAYVGLMDF